MSRFTFIFILATCVIFTLSVQAAQKSKRTQIKLEHYYVDEEMYVCRVENNKTHRVYEGRSIKESYARVWAITSCQMQSYEGQCFYRRPICNNEWVQIRKRRWVRVPA